MEWRPTAQSLSYIQMENLAAAIVSEEIECNGSQGEFFASSRWSNACAKSTENTTRCSA